MCELSFSGHGFTNDLSFDAMFASSGPAGVGGKNRPACSVPIPVAVNTMRHPQAAVEGVSLPNRS